MVNGNTQVGYRANHDRPSYQPQREQTRRSGMLEELQAGHSSLVRTLFDRTTDDLRETTQVLLTVLKGRMSHLAWLKEGKDGLFAVDDVLKAIHEERPDLGHITRNHFVEIYLRDKGWEILLSGDSIGLVGATSSVPPDIMYFGTTEVIASKASKRGIMSGTKPMFLVYDDLDRAKDAATKYSLIGGGMAAVLVLDAGQAYDDGVDFAQSGIPGTLLCEFLSHRYIKSILYADGTQEDIQGQPS